MANYEDYKNALAKAYKKSSNDILTTDEQVENTLGKSDLNLFQKYLGGAGQFIDSARHGALSSFEGIADFGAKLLAKELDVVHLDSASKAVSNFADKSLSDKYINSKFNRFAGGDFMYDVLGSIGNEGKLFSYSTKVTDNALNRQVLPEIVDNVAEGAGNALGNVAMSSGLGALVGSSSKVATTASQFAPIAVSAGGGSMVEASQDGASLNEQLGYGALSGLTEAGVEALSSKIAGGLAGKIPGTGRVAGIIGGKAGGSLAKNIVGNMYEEGTEEAISDLADPIWKKLTYKRDDKISNIFKENGGFKQVGKDFLVGAITGGLFEVASSTGNISKYASSDVSIKQNLSRYDGVLKYQEYLEANQELKDAIASNNQVAINEAKIKADSLKEEITEKLSKMFEEVTEKSNLTKEEIAEIESFSSMSADEKSKNYYSLSKNVVKYFNKLGIYEDFKKQSSKKMSDFEEEALIDASEKESNRSGIKSNTEFYKGKKNNINEFVNTRTGNIYINRNSKENKSGIRKTQENYKHGYAHILENTNSYKEAKKNYIKSLSESEYKKLYNKAKRANKTLTKSQIDGELFNDYYGGLYKNIKQINDSNSSNPITRLKEGMTGDKLARETKRYMSKAKKEHRNSNRSVTKYETSKELQGLQKASRRYTERIAGEEGYHFELHDEIRKRYSRSIQRELETRGNCLSNSKRIGLISKSKGTKFEIVTNVRGELFKDAFEILKPYIPNTESVDLHEDYSNCNCYLSSDGLQGFAIEDNGNLISVFNANASEKSGFVDAIKEFLIEEGANHLDCYGYLSKYYAKALGFKVVAEMDYNEEFANEITKLKGNKPNVFFMVDTDEKVDVKHFDKYSYEEAVNHQRKFISDYNKSQFRFSKSESDYYKELKDTTDNYFAEDPEEMLNSSNFLFSKFDKIEDHSSKIINKISKYNEEETPTKMSNSSLSVLKEIEVISEKYVDEIVDYINNNFIDSESVNEENMSTELQEIYKYFYNLLELSNNFCDNTDTSSDVEEGRSTNTIDNNYGYAEEIRDNVEDNINKLLDMINDIIDDYENIRFYNEENVKVTKNLELNDEIQNAISKTKYNFKINNYFKYEKNYVESIINSEESKKRIVKLVKDYSRAKSNSSISNVCFQTIEEIEKLFNETVNEHIYKLYEKYNGNINNNNYSDAYKELASLSNYYSTLLKLANSKFEGISFETTNEKEISLIEEREEKANKLLINIDMLYKNFSGISNVIGEQIYNINKKEASTVSNESKEKKKDTIKIEVDSSDSTNIIKKENSNVIEKNETNSKKQSNDNVENKEITKAIEIAKISHKKEITKSKVDKESNSIFQAFLEDIKAPEIKYKDDPTEMIKYNPSASDNNKYKVATYNVISILSNRCEAYYENIEYFKKVINSIGNSKIKDAVIKRAINEISFHYEKTTALPNKENIKFCIEKYNTIKKTYDSYIEFLSKKEQELVNIKVGTLSEIINKNAKMIEDSSNVLKKRKIEANEKAKVLEAKVEEKNKELAKEINELDDKKEIFINENTVKANGYKSEGDEVKNIISSILSQYNKNVNNKLYFANNYGKENTIVLLNDKRNLSNEACKYMLDYIADRYEWTIDEYNKASKVIDESNNNKDYIKKIKSKDEAKPTKKETTKAPNNATNKDEVKHEQQKDVNPKKDKTLNEDTVKKQTSEYAKINKILEIEEKILSNSSKKALPSSMTEEQRRFMSKGKPKYKTVSDYLAFLKETDPNLVKYIAETAVRNKDLYKMLEHNVTLDYSYSYELPKNDYVITQTGVRRLTVLPFFYKEGYEEINTKVKDNNSILLGLKRNKYGDNTNAMIGRAITDFTFVTLNAEYLIADYTGTIVEEYRNRYNKYLAEKELNNTVSKDSENLKNTINSIESDKISKQIIEDSVLEDNNINYDEDSYEQIINKQDKQFDIDIDSSIEAFKLNEVFKELRKIDVSKPELKKQAEHKIERIVNEIIGNIQVGNTSLSIAVESMHIKDNDKLSWKAYSYRIARNLYLSIYENNYNIKAIGQKIINNQFKKDYLEFYYSNRHINQIVNYLSKMKDIKNRQYDISTQYGEVANELKPIISILLDTISRNGYMKDSVEIRTAMKKLENLINENSKVYEELGSDIEAYAHILSSVLYETEINEKTGRKTSMKSKPLTRDEWLMLWRVVRKIRQASNAPTTVSFGGKKVIAENVAKDVISSVKGVKNKQGKMAVTKIAEGYLSSVVDPYTRMALMQGISENDGFFTSKLYPELVKASDSEKNLQYDLGEKYIKALNDKKTKLKKNLLNNTYEFCGKTITDGEAITLYMSSKRNQALNHMLNDGKEYKGKGITITDKKGVIHTINTITKEDIDNVAKYVTKNYSDFIGILEEIFYEKSGKLYNELMLRKTGYMYSLEENYFPIEGEKTEFKRKDGDPASLNKVFNNYYNPSFMKDISNRSNSEIRIRNVISVVNNYIDTMSSFYSFYPVIDDYNSVMNAKIYIDENGNISQDGEGNITTARQYIAKNVDKNFDKYMNQLIMNIQGNMTSEQGKTSKLFSTARTITAVSALGANVKVSLQQLASYPMAFAELKNTSLISGVTVNPSTIKSISDAMKNNSPYFRSRMTGDSAVKAEILYNNGISGVINKTSKFFTKGISYMDSYIMIQITKASLMQVKPKGMSLKEAMSNDEIMKKAVELAEKVSRRTQPQYDALENGSITKTNSEIIKSFLMFTSVGRKYLSSFVSKIHEFQVSENKKESFKGVCKSGTGLLASGFVATAIAMLVNYGLLGKDDDKEELEDPSDYVIDFGKQFFQNTVVNLFPILNLAYSKLVEKYDASNITVDMINDVSDAFLNIYELAFKGTSSQSELTSAMYSFTKTIGSFFGIPVKNLTELFVYPLSNMNVESAVKTKSLLLDTNRSENLSKATSEMKKGRVSLATNYVQQAFVNEGMQQPSKQVAKELARLYSNGYTNAMPSMNITKFSVDGVTYELSSKASKKFSEIYGEANAEIELLIASQAYSKLSDEKKAYYIKKIYTAYNQIAKSEIITYAEIDLDNFTVAVDSLGATKIITIMNKIDSLKSKNTSNKKEVIEKYINSVTSNKELRKVLMALAGYSE